MKERKLLFWNKISNPNVEQGIPKQKSLKLNLVWGNGKG